MRQLLICFMEAVWGWFQSERFKSYAATDGHVALGKV